MPVEKLVVKIICCVISVIVSLESIVSILKYFKRWIKSEVIESDIPKEEWVIGYIVANALGFIVIAW